MLKNWLIKFSLLCLFAIPATCLAVTPPIPASPPGQVIDLAGIIDSGSKEQLIRILHELEQKTSVQMVILTLTSLDGEDINTVSLRTAEQWKLGQKDKDNGLLFTVSLQDRRYRFETGYGLESVLPDGLLGTLGRQTLVPYFKQGNYGQGIAAATGAVIDILANHYQVEITGRDQLPQAQSHKNSSAASLVVLLVMLLLFAIFAMANKKNKRSSGGTPPIIFPVGWGSGGGFGGGGFGGGFGGGGGGFGGGGVSGGW